MERKIYGPVKLPSGKEIHFVEPLGRDRQDIFARAIGEGRQAEMLFLIDSYWLPGKCLVDAGGQFVAPDYYTAFDNWSDKDARHYRMIFDELFGVSDEQRTTAKAEAARFLLSGPTSSAG